MKTAKAPQRINLSNSGIKASLLRERGFLLKLFQQLNTLPKLKTASEQNKKAQPNLLRSILTR